MNDIGRRVFRSGVYALLATAFVLACSLLVPAGQADTRFGCRFEPAHLVVYRSSLSGAIDQDQPEPGAGDDSGGGHETAPPDTKAPAVRTRFCSAFSGWPRRSFTSEERWMAWLLTGGRHRP